MDRNNKRSHPYKDSRDSRGSRGGSGFANKPREESSFVQPQQPPQAGMYPQAGAMNMMGFPQQMYGAPNSGAAASPMYFDPNMLNQMYQLSQMAGQLGSVPGQMQQPPVAGYPQGTPAFDPMALAAMMQQFQQPYMFQQMQQQQPMQYQQPVPSQQSRGGDSYRESSGREDSSFRSRSRDDSRSNDRDSRKRDRSSDRQSRDRDRNFKNFSEKDKPDLPSRTLFVRNVKFDTTEEQLRELFSRFGEIMKVFNLLEKRGLCFITFYDIRASENARREMNNSDVNGRLIDVHFSVPKDEDMSSRQCDEDKNQGTILLTHKEGNSDLKNSELRVLFGKYGDLKIVRDYKGHPNQRFIEFWDSRHCKAAVKALQGKNIGGGHLDLRFAWDTPTKYRKEVIRADGVKAIDVLDDRTRRRTSNDDDNLSKRASENGSSSSLNHWTPRSENQSAAPLNQEAQQAQSLLASFAQQPPTSSIPVIPAGMFATPAATPTQVAENVSPAPVGGQEALAQMNQLLSLLQKSTQPAREKPGAESLIASNDALPKANRDPRAKASVTAISPPVAKSPVIESQAKKEETMESLASKLLDNAPESPKKSPQNGLTMAVANDV